MLDAPALFIARGVCHDTYFCLMGHWPLRTPWSGPPPPRTRGDRQYKARVEPFQIPLALRSCSATWSCSNTQTHCSSSSHILRVCLPCNRLPTCQSLLQGTLFLFPSLSSISPSRTTLLLSPTADTRDALPSNSHQRQGREDQGRVQASQRCQGSRALHQMVSDALHPTSVHLY